MRRVCGPQVFFQSGLNGWFLLSGCERREVGREDHLLLITGEYRGIPPWQDEHRIRRRQTRRRNRQCFGCLAIKTPLDPWIGLQLGAMA